MDKEQPSEQEKLDTLNGMDACAATRAVLQEIAMRNGEWAGIPLALEGGPQLIVEKTYPYAQIFNQPDEPLPEGVKTINRFYSRRYRCEIYIWREPDGRISWGAAANAHQFMFQLRTLDASAAWGIEQEAHALHLLGGLIRHHQFKQYLLTGMFLERSKRSGVWYLFRKLRPTLALSPRPKNPDEGLKFLCAMCMHPIGYYEGSWAGAMCPTDDVIAHLMLMRGDEHMFWRRCNQHPHYLPNAGL